MNDRNRSVAVEVSYNPVVTESIAAQISEKIRESILDGRLKVNDRLPTEEELARQFKVSRPTIREALKRLAAQHLVRSRRGPTGGTFVKRPSLDELNSNLSLASTLMVSLGEFDVDGILEARQELEFMCARLAAERRTDEHLEAMDAEIAYQKRGDLTDVDFCASDVRFHRLITDAAGNAVVRFLMHAVIEALQPIETMIMVRVRERKIIIGQHIELLKAIRQQDADKAGQSLKDQIAYLRGQFAAAEDQREKRQQAGAAAVVEKVKREPAAKRVRA